MSSVPQSFSNDPKYPFLSNLIYPGEVFVSQMNVTSLLLNPSGVTIYHSDLCYFKPFSTLHLEQNRTASQEQENKTNYFRSFTLQTISVKKTILEQKKTKRISVRSIKIVHSIWTELFFLKKIFSGVRLHLCILKIKYMLIYTKL